MISYDFIFSCCRQQPIRPAAAGEKKKEPVRNPQDFRQTDTLSVPADTDTLPQHNNNNQQNNGITDWSFFLNVSLNYYVFEDFEDVFFKDGQSLIPAMHAQYIHNNNNSSSNIHQLLLLWLGLTDSIRPSDPHRQCILQMPQWLEHPTSLLIRPLRYVIFSLRTRSSTSVGIEILLKLGNVVFIISQIV